MNRNSTADFVSKLCPNCGLCCNGVLFADVELRKGDDARRLSDLGLVLIKKGSKPAFTQSCTCFDGKLCRIYAERPVRCRTFECGLLKLVQTGRTDVKAALKAIREARRRLEKVRRLLRLTGQPDERLALINRYIQAMSKPIDLSGGKQAVESRGELMQAVEHLMQLLQRDFLK